MRRPIPPLALAALALGARRDRSGPDRPIAVPLSRRVGPARGLGDRAITADGRLPGTRDAPATVTVVTR